MQTALCSYSKCALHCVVTVSAHCMRVSLVKVHTACLCSYSKFTLHVRECTVRAHYMCVSVE